MTQGVSQGSSPPPALEARGSARREVPRPAAIFDPVARTLDAIGDRWSLVLVRQLLLGTRGFQELRHRTGIAPRVLSSRLKDLVEQGFVEALPGVRAGYALTDRGRSLEPIVASIARWFTRHGMEDLELDAGSFTETSPQSIIESLPFLLREERGPDVTFEIRLTGTGGGVWTVRIDDGQCTVTNDFAEHADVRYTADAREWCRLALGLADARELIKNGSMTKDGGEAAMDQYFHQIARSGPAPAASKGEAK